MGLRQGLLCLGVVGVLLGSVMAASPPNPDTNGGLGEPAPTSAFAHGTYPGDLTLTLSDCDNDIFNNQVNGSLSVVFSGNFKKCEVTIRVHANKVKGSLLISVNSNTIEDGGLSLYVEDNPMVGGTLKVTVRENTIHQKDPGLPLPYNLRVEVKRNGGADDAKSNQAVRTLDVTLGSNWVKNDLILDVEHNRADEEIRVKALNNIVNNMASRLEGNRACDDIDVEFRSNTLDRRGFFGANDNVAGGDLTYAVDSTKNIFTDRILEVILTDNHALDDLTLRVESNRKEWDDIRVRYEDNGAMDDGRLIVRRNEAILHLEVLVLRNHFGGHASVTVQFNKPAPPKPYEVKGTWSCKAGPSLDLQAGATTDDNKQFCTATSGPDGDADGLSDDYEDMIGTDLGNWDTDRDGLSDGWKDASGTPVFGEIGDPSSPSGGSFAYAIQNLFQNPKEAPHVLCKDLYVEMDFMRKGPTIRRPGTPAGGLQVTKVANLSQAPPGYGINYTINYTNGGPVARNVWVNDTLPALMAFVSASPSPSFQSGASVRWNFSQITRGTRSITLLARIDPNASLGAVLVNVVEVNFTDNQGDPGPASLANATVTVAATPGSLPAEVRGITLGGGTFSLSDKEHRMDAGEVRPLVDAFLRRGIRLHVDLGWRLGPAGGDAPGGGERLRHIAPIEFIDATRFDFFNFKNGEVGADYNGDGIREPRHFSTNRKGVFHYAIVGHNYSRAGTPTDSSGVAELKGDDLFLAHGVLLGQGWNGGQIHKAMSYIFCHELGHNLDLGRTPGTHERAPADYWSCMSYNASVAFHLVDYDHRADVNDDWAQMDLQGGVANWRTHDPSK